MALAASVLSSAVPIEPPICCMVLTCLAIVLDGLRAGPESRPLTTPALTDDELESTMARSLRPRARR